MINNLYGGIAYPKSSFVFDKVYNSYTEANNNKQNDGVLIGRYILIAYCNTAFSQDERNKLIGEIGPSFTPHVGDNLTDAQKFQNNFFQDGKISNDRKVYRKIYKDNSYEYEEIALLNSSLSDDSIAILGLDTDEKILSIDKETRVLSSTIELKHEDGKLHLKGHKGDIHNPISTSALVKENIIEDDYLKWDNTNKKMYLDLSDLVDRANPILSMTDEKLSTTLKIEYISDPDNTDYYQHIVLKGNDDDIFADFDASIFVKDSFLRTVEYNESNELVFTFTTYDITTGEWQDQEIPVILDIMDAGSGITISGNAILIKLDPNSENFLTVGNNGLKLSGVQNAINEAKNEAIAAAENKVYKAASLNELNEIEENKNIGDIGIVITDIVDEKKSYTAYVWQKEEDQLTGHWEAMDGNYNADNVYFDDDIMVTKEIGYVTLNNGNGYIRSKGKNLVQVFDSMFTQEQDPSKTDPWVNVTLNKAGSYEVGETVTDITCSVSFKDGAYSYGPEPTGAKVTSWEIKDSNNKTYNYSASAISIPNVLVTDGINYTITAKAHHSIGDIPKTNKGNDCTDTTKRIAAGAKENTSSAITGYRYAFAGGTNASALNSIIIRGMSAKKSSKASMDTQGEALQFSAAKGSTKVFFAYPSTWSGTPYFEMFGLAWAENVNFVQKGNVQVADARGGSNGLSYYKLYVWELNPGLEAENTNFRVWFK